MISVWNVEIINFSKFSEIRQKLYCLTEHEFPSCRTRVYKREKMNAMQDAIMKMLSNILICMQIHSLG